MQLSLHFSNSCDVVEHIPKLYLTRVTVSSGKLLM